MPRLLIGLVLALALASCERDPSGAEPVPGAPITTAGQPAPDPVGEAPGCSAAATKAVVKGFFAALSAGRVTGLDEFFAPAGRFKWYANGVQPARRVTSDARDRSTLLGYLQRRQAKHERIIVDAVQVNISRQADHSGNFSMLLRRTADDIPDGPQLLGGKGKVDCDSQRLMVVAIGIRP